MRFSDKLQAWVTQNLVWLQSIISLLAVFSSGIYINLLTNTLQKNPSLGLSAIWEMGVSNLLLVATIIMFIFNAYLASIPQSAFQKIGTRIIENILEVACASLTQHKKDLVVRATVTLISKDLKTRTTRFSYNVRPDPERTATFPVEFGITGKAILNRMVVARDLEPNHMDRYPPEIKPLILPELKCVLAAPIYFPEKSELGPVGVLAFDSTSSLSVTKFDTRRAKIIAQLWADVIGEILARTNIYKLYPYPKRGRET